MRDRRSKYDVTNTVNLHDTASTRDAVIEILLNTSKNLDIGALKRAFEDCDKLFNGEYADYLPCDTLYHDQQHTFDVTLALSRLIDGHESTAKKEHRIGPERALIGIIAALYHDCGYIRRKTEHEHHNGAEFARIHVSRGAEFLKRYLHKIGLGQHAQVAASMIHYTGDEIGPEQIRLPDQKMHRVGHMLGTADLIAQMADRCYLEKCRYRLYPELVIGGIAVQMDASGRKRVIFSSGEDLLRKTPAYMASEIDHRLNVVFNKAYNYETGHFDGERKYIDALGKNQARLKKVIRENDFSQLRRRPPANYGTRSFPGLEAYLNRHPLRHRKFG